MSGTLEIKQVNQAYGSRLVLNDINFRLNNGTIACLLGASGCGKTTVLRCIAGFEKVAAGEILINDETVSRPGFLTPPESRRIGMVFQDYALFPHLTVARNVAFGLHGMAQEARTPLGSTSYSKSSASPASAIVIRTKSAAASSSALPSPAHWRHDPR